MADLIVGYPSNLTVVTAGAGGNVRVTYPPWELDWEFFDAIAVGHWLANITSGVSVDITAKGGQENLGYWFEINQAFPSANWASGNRITPQRQAAIQQYNTIAAAKVGMAVMDVLLMWYDNAANCQTWYEGLTFSSKAPSIWGMLSRCRINIGPVNLTIDGNNLAQVNQVFVRNLSGAVNWSYTSTAAQEGAGIRFTRNLLICGANINVGRKSVGGVNQIDNCCVGFPSPNSGSCFNVSTHPALLYNNTAWFGGFNLGSVAGTIVTNCVSLGAGFAGTVGVTLTYCAETTNTLPVAAGNQRNLNMRTQMRVLYDLSRAGDKTFEWDARICGDSVLAGAGIAIPAITYDQDGRTRPNPPSIGAYEPYAPAYAPSARMVRGCKFHKAGA